MFTDPVSLVTFEASVLTRNEGRSELPHFVPCDFSGKSQMYTERETLFRFLGWKPHISYEKVVLTCQPHIKPTMELTAAVAVLR
jgi:hypothetical protein